MMDNSYDALASIYDLMQADVDYKALALWMHKLRLTHMPGEAGQGSDGRHLWLDLGCGTGSLLLELASLDYDLIGLDLSEDMLMAAQEKFMALGQDHVLLSQQDITDFELFGQVDICSIILDTVNHLPDAQHVLRMLKLSFDYLIPNGILIFDVMTEHHARDVLGEEEFFVLDESYALFWENEYDEEHARTKANLTLFEEVEDGLYERYELSIEEQIYTDEAIRGYLREAGFHEVYCLAPLSDKAPEGLESRVFYVAKKD